MADRATGIGRTTLSDVAQMLHKTQRNSTDLRGTGWTAHHLEPLL